MAGTDGSPSLSLSCEMLQPCGNQSPQTSQPASVLSHLQEKCETAGPPNVTIRKPITSCPDGQLLIAYADGMVPAQRIQAIERHLAGCLQCREVYSRLLAFERAQGIRMIGDRYTILKELGRGGMGTVYQVLDVQTQEILALKLLRSDLACDERSLRRFENELRVARTIAHPNLCRSYSFGWTSESAYITMEFIEGSPLRHLLRSGCTLDVSGGLKIARQICAALFELHKRNIVHRDLKPENVIVSDHGRVVIVDFGLARLLGTESTVSSGLVGTLAYMSPEQIEGKVVDGRSDIYALGLILYEMFTGTAPFLGENAIALALKQVHGVPTPPRAVNPSIPRSLELGILRCLQKNPVDRFDSVPEIDRLLERIAAAYARSVRHAARA